MVEPEANTGIVALLFSVDDALKGLKNIEVVGVEPEDGHVLVWALDQARTVLVRARLSPIPDGVTGSFGLVDLPEMVRVVRELSRQGGLQTRVETDADGNPTALRLTSAVEGMSVRFAFRHRRYLGKRPNVATLEWNATGEISAEELQRRLRVVSGSAFATEFTLAIENGDLRVKVGDPDHHTADVTVIPDCDARDATSDSRWPLQEFLTILRNASTGGRATVLSVALRGAIRIQAIDEYGEWSWVLAGRKTKGGRT